jgi:chromosome segregation ATPase
MRPYANHGELERAEREIMNLRAQLERATADLTTTRALMFEAERQRDELEARRRHVEGRTNEIIAERDQARRELVHAMQTIEAASLALGGVREQREQPGEIEEQP